MNLTIQIINLSDSGVFKKYSNTYKIFRDLHQSGLMALEIRNIEGTFAEKIRKVVLKEDEICYKSEKTNNTLVSLLIPGYIKNIKELARKILAAGDEDLGYRITNIIKNYEEYDSIRYKIGNKEFSFDKSYTMGILNVTPDSFSDGGKFISVDSAVSHGLEMIEEGADIIDIGGESSRPGSEPVKAGEEIKRVLPVLEGILKQKPEALISIDTTKEKVAEEALANGAKIINDISALNFEPRLLDVVLKYDASLILMHMQGAPQNMQSDPIYNDVVCDIYDFLSEKSQVVSKSGVKNIIIDPGIGFGKTLRHNMEILKRLEDFKGLGFPLLIGVSRKSFLGKMLDLSVEERDTATSIVESLAVMRGAKIIRTHNVKYGVQVCKLLKKIM